MINHHPLCFRFWSTTAIPLRPCPPPTAALDGLPQMAVLVPLPVTSLSLSTITYQRPRIYVTRMPKPLASLDSSTSSSSTSSSSSSHESSSSSTLATNMSPFVESAKPNLEKGFNYALANPKGNPVTKFVKSSESSIERVRN